MEKLIDVFLFIMIDFHLLLDARTRTALVIPLFPVLYERIERIDLENERNHNKLIDETDEIYNIMIKNQRDHFEKIENTHL
jgi:hypothetical protein